VAIIHPRKTDYRYHRPGSLGEALDLKAELGEGARFVAGGTDVMVLSRAGRLEFTDLISLRRVPELNGVRDDGDKLVIGAGTTLSQLLQGPLVKERLAPLRDAAGVMGCTQMRNLATIGGNVMSAVASGDTLPPLLVLDARCVLASQQGERRAALAEFFPAPRKTDARSDEVLLALEIQPADGAGAYHKLGRRKALDLAVVGIAVWLELDASGAMGLVRAAAGAVGPTPVRLRAAEEVLAGKPPSDSVLSQAGEAALADCSPWDDVRASRWYREEMIKTILPRVVRQAVARAGGVS